MSSLALKLIAAAAMLCDHLGATLFPEALWLRAIGRLTMPIMAYFAAEGFRKTRNVPRYLTRLAIFAVLSEFPFFLLFSKHSNVIVTLFLGVAALFLGELCEKKLGRKVFRAMPYLLCAALATALNSDWTFTGVFLVIVFFHAGKSKLKTLLYPLPVYLVYFLSFLTGGMPSFLFQLSVQIWALCALPLLCFYNGRRGAPVRGFTGNAAKYFFYVFYPLHLIIIYFIKTGI